MEKIAVITDSATCLPREVAEQFHVEVVPINLLWDGRIYRDGLDMSPEEFYSRLRTAKKLPTTSPSSPGTYLEIFRRLGQEASHLLCFTVSCRLSAMYDSAQAARELIREISPGLQIEVLDSGTAAMAQGFAVIEACRAVARGAPFSEVVATAKDILGRVRLIAFLETLSFLARSGRVPQVAAWAGSLLKLRPLFQLRQGEIRLLERPRTTARGLQRLVAVSEASIGRAPVHMAIMHAGAPEKAEELKSLVLSRFDCRELYVTPFTPVMGSHTGPGLLGLSFYAES